MGLALLGCVEHDFPDQLPPIAWAGVCAGKAPTNAAAPPRDLPNIQSPLLTLRDGLDSQDERPGFAPAADTPSPRPTPPSREGGVATKPFPFVHGYPLPTPWARRDRGTQEPVREVYTR